MVTVNRRYQARHEIRDDKMSKKMHVQIRKICVWQKKFEMMQIKKFGMIIYHQ